MSTFKVFLLSLFLCGISSLVLAQAAWHAPLQAQLTALSTNESPEQLSSSLAVIERIAAANPDAWLPNYYAAHLSLQQHWMGSNDGCASCLTKADTYLSTAEASDNNSEVMTLRARYYQAMLGMHPMRAAFYGPKATTLLEQAVAADADNPRAVAVLGQNIYYTPSMFGGGASKARPHLAKAVELYEREAANAERDALLPTWGSDVASTMLSNVDSSKE